MPPIVQLHDGTPVHLRLLKPADRDAVIEALHRLSPDSRYYRFWSKLEGVSENLLQRFLNPEPGQHETWVAQDPERLGEPGYGGGSFWRSERNPEEAEISFIVADEAQRRGVGTLLLALIWVRAEKAGITRFTGHVLPDNYSVLDWFRALGAGMHYQSGQYTFEVVLDESRLRKSVTSAKLTVWLQKLREMESLAGK